MKVFLNRIKSIHFNRYIFLLVVGAVALILAGGAYFLNTRGFFDKSQAYIALENDELSVTFNIIQKDKMAAAQFSQNLGVDESWEKGIRLKVDPDSQKFLGSNLPATLNLEFDPKGVSFHNRIVAPLSSALSGKSVSLASGSGVLNMVINNAQDFSLNMQEPADLIPGATSSGMIYLSSQLSGLLDLGQKIATIDLKVNSGNISGYIKLK